MQLEQDRQYLNVTYKKIAEVDITLDVYPPILSGNPQAPKRVPALVYFHGGGLTVGSAQSWFPTWLQTRVTASGYAFISANYRLVPPSSGHDVLEDIKDLFTFINNGDLDVQLDIQFSTTLAQDTSFPRFYIDSSLIAVAGSSSGGLCAYLAAMHVKPSVKGLLCMYGMGGDLMTHHYISAKTQPFFRGREILDPSEFSDYIYPYSPTSPLQPVSESPLAYYPATHVIPGYPANPRMLLGRLYLQLGVWLDYYTGEHEPSLSSKLRDALKLAEQERSTSGNDSSGISGESLEHLRRLIPERHLPLFPQFGVTPDWPPTYLAHGALDSAVPIHDSGNMRTLLERAGVSVEFDIIEGKEHSFDYEPNAEAMYGSGQFSSMGNFIERCLGRAPVVKAC